VSETGACLEGLHMWDLLVTCVLVFQLSPTGQNSSTRLCSQPGPEEKEATKSSSKSATVHLAGDTFLPGASRKPWPKPPGSSVCCTTLFWCCRKLGASLLQPQGW
jgi:hypothetical protein